MPDFDIDFCNERREEVIRYVERKYGKDHVSQIITFGTMSARMVIRDVGRVLNMPYAKVDKIAKKITMKNKITIETALEESKELKEEYDNEFKGMLNIDITNYDFSRNPFSDVSLNMNAEKDKRLAELFKKLRKENKKNE